MSHARDRPLWYSPAMRPFPYALYYLAHCVRPLEGETLEGNLAAAQRWLQFFCVVGPEMQIDMEATWLAELTIPVVDRDAWEATSRTAGMARNQRIAARCDGIILCGPRLSTGMLEERAVFLNRPQTSPMTIVNLVGIATPEDLVSRTDGTTRGLEALLYQMACRPDQWARGSIVLGGD